MSITNAYIIPENEKYVPNKKDIEAITNVIDNYNNFKISYEENSSLQFYDCGENFESILCPFCKSDLDIEWWQDEMCKASESNFSDINIITPCCLKNSSLNNLDYHYLQGFSMFAIKIEDYELYTSEKCLLSELQDITGERWNLILSRY